MLYLNQLEYEQIPYRHDLNHGGAPEGKNTVAAAGCGPCSLCMIVENLTTAKLDLEDCLEMSVNLRANMEPGTDLKILGPAVAEKFGLAYKTTSDVGELAEHLRRGGMAVANSGGDYEGHIGVFTHGGHYVVVVSVDGDEVCILDPSYRKGKYEEEGRKGKVHVAEPFAYCSLDVLKEDCANRDPSFYLFARKR